MNYNPSKPRLYCAESRQPLARGQDVYEVTFRKGVINQDYDFMPFGSPERIFFSSQQYVHKYTSPRGTFLYKKPMP